MPLRIPNKGRIVLSQRLFNELVSKGQLIPGAEYLIDDINYVTYEDFDSSNSSINSTIEGINNQVTELDYQLALTNSEVKKNLQLSKTYTDNRLGEIPSDTTVKAYADNIEVSLNESITHLTSLMNSQISELNSSKISKSITPNNELISDAELDYDNLSDSLSLSISYLNVDTGIVRSLATAFPVASSTVSGLMTKENVSTLIKLVADVESLKQGGVWRGSYSTYESLVSAYPNLDVSSTNWFINDYVLVESDSNYDGNQTSYIVDSNKHLQFRRLEHRDIPIANNSTLGVVKSSSDLGKIYVDTDGSMSLVGYDSITNRLNAIDDPTNGSVSGLSRRITNLESSTPGVGAVRLKDGYELYPSPTDPTYRWYTLTEKNKLSGISSGAQVNVIEGIKRNGTSLIPVDKIVDIIVPTTASEVGALPDTTTYVTSINGQSGVVINIATTDEVNDKVSKVEGKDLSTNDYTNDDKLKLDSLANIKTIGDNLSLNSEGNLSATVQETVVDNLTISKNENGELYVKEFTDDSVTMTTNELVQANTITFI